MAESTIPNTGDPRVHAALERIRGKFTDLEDAMLVQVQLEKRAAERVKEHAEFIASHEAAVNRFDQQLAAEAAQRRALDERVDKLVSAIGELIRSGRAQ